MASTLLVLFGVVSSLLLIGAGLHRAATRNYRDRAGNVHQGAAAVRAGLVVALVGLCELALTVYLGMTG